MKDLMTTREVAQELGLTRNQVAYHVAKGRVKPAYRANVKGSEMYFRPGDLDELREWLSKDKDILAAWLAHQMGQYKATRRNEPAGHEKEISHNEALALVIVSGARMNDREDPFTDSQHEWAEGVMEKRIERLTTSFREAEGESV